MRNLLLAVYLTLPTVAQAVTSECTLQKGDSNSILTCTFSEDVSTLNKFVKIVRRTGLDTGSEAPVLCHWTWGKPNCQMAPGFQLAGTITNTMTIIIRSSLVDNGIYSCRLLPLNVLSDNFGKCTSTQKCHLHDVDKGHRVSGVVPDPDLTIAILSRSAKNLMYLVGKQLHEDDVRSGDEDFARYIRQSNGMDSLYLTGRASEKTLKRAACLLSATEGTASFNSQLSNIESETINRPDYLDLNNETSDQKGTNLMSILQSKDNNLKVSGGEDRGKISHSDYSRLESDTKRDVHNYDSLGKELTPAQDNVRLWFWCWYQAFILQNIVFGATGAGRALPNWYSPFSHPTDVSTLGGTGRMTVSPGARQNLNNRLNAPSINPESQDEEDTDYIID